MSQKISAQVQGRAIEEVRDYRTQSENLTTDNRERLLRVYQAYKTFRQQNYGYDTGKRMRTDFKVNKAHEIVEKVLVRIIGRDPKWIVTPRNIASFANDDEEVFETMQGEDGTIQKDYTEAVKDRSGEYSEVTQDYLTYIFDEYNLRERFKIAAKNLVVYGKCYAKPTWKYEVARLSYPSKQEEEVTDTTEVMQDGGEVVEEEEVEVERTDISIKNRVEEKVIGQYPTIEVVSWTDMYYDPRYVFLDDRPAMVEVVEGVRLAQLMKDKKAGYINLDKLEKMLGVDVNLDQEQYKRRIRQISGIETIEPKILNKNSLKVTKYYGYFSITDKAKDEKLYEICTVDDVLCISFKEITRQPIEECKCFDDPETAFATGFVEPIMGLQEEMNWKKNSASEYINQMLTRRFIWSPFSGINPKDVMNPIIATTKGGQEALSNFPELKLSEINPSYFQEENDFERQIQAMSFTVDTSNPRSENALTNTATGARIKFFESNSVLDEVRKSFEKFLERVAYGLLMETFENLSENIVFKKQGTEGYWNANKEFLRNAVQRYSIRVEANSSSYDSIESRREDAIAFLNGSMMLKQSGVNMNMEQIAEDYVETWEKRDPSKYIAPPSPMQSMQELGMSPGQPLPQPTPRGNAVADLTQQVARGDLQSLIP